MFISVNNLLKMWKWLKGATEPKDKRKQRPEECAEWLKEYEAKSHKYSFCVEWKLIGHGYGENWLMGARNLCSVITVSRQVCQLKKTNFVHGCPSLCIESIKKHEASSVHVFAANKHKNEVTPNEAPAWKAKLSLNKSIFLKL